MPERLSDVTIQPVVFTLLFLYVFGSAIHIPGMSYQNYLLPGLLGQSLAFGVIGSGVATANDFTSGVIDRFPSLDDQAFVSARQVNLETIHQHDVVAERFGTLAEIRSELETGVPAPVHTSRPTWLGAVP